MDETILLFINKKIFQEIEMHFFLNYCLMKMYYKNYLTTYLFFSPFSGRWYWPGKFKNDVNLAFGLVLLDLPTLTHGYFNCNMVHNKHQSFTTFRTYSKLM